MSNAELPSEPGAHVDLYVEPWWRRILGDADSWYSGLASFAFHFCLFLLLPLLAWAFTPQDRTPPEVDVIQVAEMSTSADAGGDGLPGEDTPEISTDTDISEVPTDMLPTETIDPTVPIEIMPPDVDVRPEDLQPDIADALRRAREVAAGARAALNGNLGGSTPTGTGAGSGRAGRAARWILHFNTRNPNDYKAQLGGLGAEVAFPQQGNRYLYYSNLAGAPRSETRDLSNERRLYWFDDNPQSYRSMAQLLGARSAPFMVVFLPRPLEDKMLKLELAFKGARSEDEIAQTEFEAVPRGGGYDVIVISQKLRSE